MISRTSATILRGPAIVIRDSVTFYFKGGLKAAPRYDLFTIDTDARGKIDTRVKQILWEITGTPVGMISSGVLSALYPHVQCNPGVSALPSSDVPLVIHPLNAKEKLTLSSSFVYKMPDLNLSATKTALGQVTWYAFGNNNEAWSHDDHLYTLADAAFTDTSLSNSTIQTVPFTAVLGSLAAPWASIQTKDGWNVSFDVGLDAQEVDDIGIFDWIYNGDANVTVKCKPIGIIVADLLALMKLQGTGVARGMSILDKKYDLVLSGGSTNITTTIKNCTLQAAPHAYNVGDRVEDLEFKTVRNLTTGALDAVFSVGIA